MHAIQAKRRETSQAREALQGLQGWKTLAYASDEQLEATRAELLERFGDKAKHVELRTREKNPARHLHLPPETTKIGSALELQTQFNDTRTVWDFEVKDWHVLVPDDVFDMAPGEAPIFLVRGSLETTGASIDQRRKGRIAYDLWHEREAQEVLALDGVALFSVYVGRALRFDYRSDKWNARAEHVDYTHDMTEHGHIPPEVWADVADLERAKGLVLIGGDMRVTVDGID